MGRRGPSVRPSPAGGDDGAPVGGWCWWEDGWMGEWGPLIGVASESSEDEGDAIGKPFAVHFLF